jgi:hypothetical protein
MANTYLTRTPATPTLSTKFTFSAWIKRSFIGNADNTLIAKWSSGANRGHINFSDTPDDSLQIFEQVSSSTTAYLLTNRLFRDTSAWYHIVFEADSTQATASDRLKLYVNGVQETSFSTATYPSQNYNWQLQALTNNFEIGGLNAGSSLFNGSMSHIHFIDGTAYDATAFGEYDANGVWKINTSPSVTYGTNGFFILKDGNSVTDQSGNSNNFTVGGGTLTNTEDNPSNVFCTLNPLAKPGTANTAGMGNGNTHYNKTSTGVGNNSQANGTLGASSGKYYFELKTNNDTNLLVGVNDINTKYNSDGASLGIPSVASGVGYYYNGSKYINGVETSYGNAWTTNDIVGVAFDLDNNYIYFSKLGTWQNSGDPTSGSSGTGGIALTTNITYTPAVQNFNYNFVSTAYFNFGNGYFGTTAVSSAGTNASGIGIFEYDVPTGYTALSTKGLNL